MVVQSLILNVMAPEARRLHEPRSNRKHSESLSQDSYDDKGDCVVLSSISAEEIEGIVQLMFE